MDSLERRQKERDMLKEADQMRRTSYLKQEEEKFKRMASMEKIQTISLTQSHESSKPQEEANSDGEDTGLEFGSDLKEKNEEEEQLHKEMVQMRIEYEKRKQEFEANKWMREEEKERLRQEQLLKESLLEREKAETMQKEMERRRLQQLEEEKHQRAAEERNRKIFEERKKEREREKQRFLLTKSGSVDGEVLNPETQEQLKKLSEQSAADLLKFEELKKQRESRRKMREEEKELNMKKRDTIDEQVKKKEAAISDRAEALKKRIQERKSRRQRA